MKKITQLFAMALLGLATFSACTNATDDTPVTPTPLTKGNAPSNAHKAIAVLSMIANVNYNLVTTSEAALQQNTLKIDDALKNNAAIRAYVGTDWRVVWGPVISNSPRKSNTSVADSFVTDNTMYVARGTSIATGKPMYVVGVAGTNIVSNKGWRSEDFNVFKLADWGMPNSGKISDGSQLGLTILSTMKDPGTGKTLLQFLGAQSDITSTEIAFTGHSLGGALSPLVALKCIEWKEQMGYTNLKVSVYPIAGPTPGDAQFATYAAQKFGENYFSVINNYDMVPCSWQKDMFATIPTLYSSSPPFNPGGKSGFELPPSDKLAFNALKPIIDLKTYKRIAPDREYVFNGTPNTYPDNSGTFFKEAGYQHTKAYFKDGFQFPQPVIDAITLLISNER
ncbi:lipase family protein [Spirosoma panaciterrae]|uniref:lipase family protein n=1 Tax=Spirosoma panaciterrae TaxID=496058 RepID=UPI00037880B2|nr:hypothetical protein [Spirosoma panaciterrae]